MAGPFTHWIICEEAMARPDELGRDLERLLYKNASFALLGATSPDLPYLSFIPHHTNWADKMHYEKTNGLVIRGLREVSGVGLQSALEEAQLAWLLGYASHMIADAAIHPIVEQIVGPYQDNKSDHRECEVFQDILTYRRHTNSDVVDAEYTDSIRHCSDYGHFETLLDFWEWQLKANYPGDEPPDPHGWFKRYLTALDAVDDSIVAFSLFRHVGFGDSILYQTAAEAEAGRPDLCRKYYHEIALPTGETGSFEQNGVETAVGEAARVWRNLYDEMISGQVTAADVKNWNLDTGRDQDDDNRRTYWA